MMLTSRAQMPQAQFAGPGRSFPINDATHQRMAVSGATRAYNAGNISGGEKNHIQAIARALLNKGVGHAHNPGTV